MMSVAISYFGHILCSITSPQFGNKIHTHTHTHANTHTHTLSNTQVLRGKKTAYFNLIIVVSDTFSLNITKISKKNKNIE